MKRLASCLLWTAILAVIFIAGVLLIVVPVLHARGWQ